MNQLRMTGWRVLSALLLCGAALGQAATQTASAAAPVRLTLLAFNDFHGNLLPPEGGVLLARPGAEAPQRVSAGGLAVMATLVRQIRQGNPQGTLLLGGGDMVGASPLVSAQFHDEPTILALDALGMAYSAVGNHELDQGRAHLLRLQNGGCQPPAADGHSGQVGADTCMEDGRFAGARMRYLAANVVDETTGQTLLAPYVLHRVAGITVGIVGATLRATPLVVTPSGVRGLRFEDEAQAINRVVPQMQAQGAQVIVALVHQGGQTEATTALATDCPALSGPIVALTDKLDPAVAVVISGHTHQDYICRRPDGKLLTQAGSYGRMLTQIDLQVDPKSGRVLDKQARNHVVLNGLGVRGAGGVLTPLPADLLALPADPGMEALIQRYAKLSAKLADQVIARVQAPLTRKPTPAGESVLGDVVADAYLASTADPSYGERAAQIACTNPGGLRADITGPDVTFGQLFAVLPFNNNLVTLEVTGTQLLRLLEQQWELPQPPGGRVLACSEGFTYSWDATAPERAASGSGRRVVPGSLKLRGQPVQPGQTYRLTVNSFMASGGDAFAVLREAGNAQDGEIDVQALRRTFAAREVVAPPPTLRIQLKP